MQSIYEPHRVELEAGLRDYAEVSLQPLLRRIVEACVHKRPENPTEFLRQWFNDGCPTVSPASPSLEGVQGSNSKQAFNLALAASHHSQGSETQSGFHGINTRVGESKVHESAASLAATSSSSSILHLSRQLEQRVQGLRQAIISSDFRPSSVVTSSDDAHADRSDNLFTDAVDRGFLLRDDEVLKAVYTRHSLPSQAMLSDSLPAAIRDVSQSVGLATPRICTAAVASATRGGCVKFEDFRSLLMGSGAVAVHVARSAVALVLADTIAALCGTGDDSLAKFAQLSQNALGEAVWAAAPAILLALRDVQAGLDRALSHAARKCATPADSSKFHTNKMACGSIGDFHRGLTARIGAAACVWQASCRHCTLALTLGTRISQP